MNSTILEIKGRPIAKKNNVRFSNGHTYKTKAWRRFEKDALSQLESVSETFTGEITVSYRFCMKGRLNGDLDNFMAGINDILQKAGVIDDDKNIVALSATKQGGYDDWSTIVSIQEAKLADK